MHKVNLNYFTFIEDFNKENIKKLNSKIVLIFRNYKTNISKQMLLELKDFCKTNNRKILLSNNIRLAKTLNFDGVYIPAFNKKLVNYNLGTKKKFIIIGSAHTKIEMNIKIKQKVDQIVLSPIFKVNKKKKYLDVARFNILANTTTKEVVALGGINHTNIKKLNMLNINGFASISYFEKKYNLLNKNEY